MCGIAGAFWYAGGVADPLLLARQLNALRRRGPDSAGLWCDGPVALGHRRLAIQDLSPAGHQPLPNEDHSVHVVVNGEIYNWRELRGRLATSGHRFRGSADSEVLPHLWEAHGVAMLESLRGMFALGLYDSVLQTLMLARDRVGKKPLYYHDNGRRVVFASELKALMLDPSVPRDVDPKSVAEMLAFQYVPSPGSIWRGVCKLSAAHRLICDANGAREERYWDLPLDIDRELPERDSVSRLRTLLEESVRLRMDADVPLGAFLSGGLDSSAVVALMARESAAPIRTFSVGLEGGNLADLVHARAVSRHLGTEHHEVIVQPKALDLLPKLVWGMDEPFSDASMIPTYHVAEVAREHVVVALSGDGGDEVFGGYSTYAKARRYAWPDRVPIALRRLALGPAAVVGMNRGWGRWLRRIGIEVADRHLELMSRFEPAELAGVMTPDLGRAVNGHDPFAVPRALYDRARCKLGSVPALLALDAQTFLTDDILVKVDRMSMLNSLEVRAPLLDQRVVEHAARMPFSLKLRGDVTKWALRESVRSLLPPSILERGKQGFGLPLERWFGSGLEAFGREILLDARCRARGWIDPRAVERLLRGDGVRRGRKAQQVFALCCLELWAQTWVDRPRESLDEPISGPLDIHPAAAVKVLA